MHSASPESPLHLYVHIPFCIHKCAYCDFNSHVREAAPWHDYRRALLAELRYWSEQAQFAGRCIETIFFGGGTPSLAPAELIADILQQVEALFSLRGHCEISLEANPGTLDAGRFAAYREAGVNRLSIGVQSFNDDELQWLERIHNSRQAREAFDSARSAGFANISMDLMYGLPGQDISGWLESLNTAIALAPEHLSCYQLTVEEHTELALRQQRSPLSLPEDEAALDFLRRTRSRLSGSGYQAYEISNFSRPGRHCRHNEAYWLYDDYIGIGAGAAGKWDKPDGGITRSSNIRSPEAYMLAALAAGVAINSDETLPRRKAAAEAVWLGLRRSDGLAQAHFRERFGRDIAAFFGDALQPWVASGHLSITPGHVKLTAQGIGLADSIAVAVLSS